MSDRSPAAQLAAVSHRFVSGIDHLTKPRPDKIAKLFLAVSEWAAARSDILGVVLVGSYARAEAKVESDVDLVVISDHPEELMLDGSWVKVFGSVALTKHEDWGKLQSLRVDYADGLEVEFGLTDRDWLSQPLDSGTIQVLAQGWEIIYQRNGYLVGKLPSTAEHADSQPLICDG